LFGNNNTNSLFGNSNNNNDNNNNNSFSLFSNENINANTQNNSNISNSLFGNNNFSLFGQKSDSNTNTNTNGNQTTSLFGSPLFQNNNIQQATNTQNNSIFQYINNNTNNDNNNLNGGNILESNSGKKPKSLGQILFDKMQENKESQNLSYNSEYIQEKQDEEEQNNLNKYKQKSYEISSANNININPVLKNNILSIKEYFYKGGNKFKSYRLKANSFDMSFNLESKVLLNLENSFSKKLSVNTNVSKNDKKKIAIKCQINEPHKLSFTVIVGKKVEISKLKHTICEQLGKKNKIYSSLKTNSFCLMKNYSFIPEFGTVGDTILSDGDNVYIILIDSMLKCQLKKEILEK